jgi:capsule polysaccharide export protein KpsE/RkpR
MILATPAKTSPVSQALPETERPAWGVLRQQFYEFDFWGHLFRVIRLFWQRRRLLTWIVALGVLISALIAFTTPSWYQSTLTLMPPDNQSSLETKLAALGGAGAAESFGDLLTTHTTGAQFINILRSRTVMDQIIAALDLKRVYGVRRGVDARYLLGANTDISEDRKSGVIIITVTNHDPRLAQAIAAAYVQGLDHLVSDLSTSAAHRERIFIEERLKVVKRELDDDARQLSEFSSKTAVLNLQEQGRVMFSSAATLRDQIAATESELKGLEQVYTPTNPRIRILQAKMEALEQDLNKLSGENGNSREPLTQNGGSNYPSIRELPGLGTTYQDLSQRLRMQEGVYEALTKQYEMAKVEEAKEIPSVRTLDPPNLPEQKSGPSRRLIIYLGTTISALLGCAFVLIGSAWAQIDPQDPRKIFAHEVSQKLFPAPREGQDQQAVGNGLTAHIRRRYAQRNGNGHKNLE